MSFRRFILLLLFLGTFAAPAQAGRDCPKILAELMEHAPWRRVPSLQVAIDGVRPATGHAEWGPRLRLSLNSSTRAEDMKTLTLGQYNVLNLVAASAEEVSGRSAIHGFAKPEEELRGVASAIERSGADVLVLEEIGSRELLERFNDSYLGGRYVPALVPGNDERGAHVGFLIRRDLPFDVELQSFRHAMLESGNAPVFSRDLPVLIFREKGADPSSSARFILAGTHFKSKRVSHPGVDTAQIRRRQADAAARILEGVRRQDGAEIPVFLAGDFNDDLRVAPEFEPLKEVVGLRDSFDLAPAGASVAKNARTTQTFHPSDGSPTVQSQLDGILFSGGVSSDGVVREAGIVPYLDGSGNVKPVPLTFLERRQNPSDHFMVRTVVDYSRLRMLSSRTKAQ